MLPLKLLTLSLQQSPCHQMAAPCPPLLTLQALLHLVDPPVLLPLHTPARSLAASPKAVHHTAPIPAPLCPTPLAAVDVQPSAVFGALSPNPSNAADPLPASDTQHICC